MRKWYSRHRRECLKVIMTWRYTVCLVNSKVIQGKQNVVLRLEMQRGGWKSSWRTVKRPEIAKFWRTLLELEQKSLGCGMIWPWLKFKLIILKIMKIGWAVQWTVIIQMEEKSLKQWPLELKSRGHTGQVFQRNLARFQDLRIQRQSGISCNVLFKPCHKWWPC